jgi:hypothetical protein
MSNDTVYTYEMSNDTVYTYEMSNDTVYTYEMSNDTVYTYEMSNARYINMNTWITSHFNKVANDFKSVCRQQPLC